jgi:hypothetical protein
MANPDRASMELPGRDAMPVAPQRLDGADRAQAWQRITAAQPRYAKYQRKNRPGIPSGPTHPAVTAYSGPLPRPRRQGEPDVLLVDPGKGSMDAVTASIVANSY